MVTIKKLLNKEPLYAATSFSRGVTMQVMAIHLSAHDNDPQYFWKSFHSALTVWNVQFSQRERQKPFPAAPIELELFLQAFCGEVKENPLMLILNNAHLVTGEQVDSFIKSLMDLHIPELSVVLLYNDAKADHTDQDSTSRPYVDRCRYLTEEDEQAHYQSHHIVLSEEEFQRARRFTDGWIAAVELIEELLTANDKETIFPHFETYLNNMFESRYFSHYNDLEQRGIITLSLLDEFPIELVQTFAHWDGERSLARLTGSPLIRYNHESKCFSFAPFIHPQLQVRQVLLDHKYKQDFYTRVGDWCKDHGDTVSAISYYRKAGADKRILKVMQQWTFPNSREVALCYIEAINNMRASFLDRNPLLHVIRGHMLCTLYRYKDADILLSRFCAAHDQGEDTPAELRSVLGEAFLVWGNTCINLLKDTSTALSAFKRAAELLPNGSAMIRNKLNLLADCPVIRLPSPEAGSMRRYLEFLRQLEPCITQVTNGGWCGAAALAVAEMNYYARNLGEVEGNARTAISLALEKGQYDIVCSAYYLLMRHNLAKGNYQRTMESLDLLKQAAGEARYDTFFSMPDLAESWLLLKLGHKHEVAEWIRDESLYQKTVMPWNYGRDRIARCHYLLECQQYDQVAVYADYSINLLRKRGYNLMILLLQMMKAVSLHFLGESEKSVRVMEEVYRWTHANGIVMPIVEYGRYVRPLLEHCRRQGSSIPEEWLEDIGTKANSYYTYTTNIRKRYMQKKKIAHPLLESLTAAEQRMLVMISRGMTAREIAEQTGKSMSAVKGMSRRVYEKIGAEGKAEAVRIATEYHIEQIAGV